MVFSSASFLFVFLPIVFILYYLTNNQKIQNIILIAFSLLFYSVGEPLFVFVMIVSVFINYLLAKQISKDHKKIYLTLAVILNLLLIGIFKYTNFFVDTINTLLQIHIKVPTISLPVGISFFTFQILSYVIDVYRHPETVQHNYFKLLLYVSFFPQLIAGPIVKYHDVMNYIDQREKNSDEIVKGIERFIVGLSKKLFLANTMGHIADLIFALPLSQVSTLSAWIGSIAYLFQIFFDFSGYSDMAIGLGHMFGFTFLENFNYPYISTSIKEFWRRWHISLSTWFKEYLYIPLGGNRVSTLRTYINRFIVFFCTGLWHGASWTFVVWGLLHGISMIIEDVTHLNVWTKKHKYIGWFYTMMIVLLTFVLFRSDTFIQGATIVKNMFIYSKSSISTNNVIASIFNYYNLFILVLCILCSIPLHKYISLPKDKKIQYIFIMALYILCILNIANNSYNPFIYFRF